MVTASQKEEEKQTETECEVESSRRRTTGPYERNSIRPGAVASLQANGEAQTRENGEPATLKGSVRKRWRDTPGGWSRNGQEGDLREAGRPAR